MFAKIDASAASCAFATSARAHRADKTAMTPVAGAADFVITRDMILRQAQALPAAPQVLGGLCELLEDINTDLDQIAEQIRVDPALTARVIRLSNSVVFGGRGTVGSVDEAVNRVGFAEITRLVGVATVAGLVDRALGSYGIAAERMRESLLLHAFASEALARHLPIDPRSAYAAGLLRGVGMMVLDWIARGRITAADAFDGARFGSYAAWEQVRFGVTGAEVTTMVLDEWRFPAELVSAIEAHALPSAADGANPFAAVLHLAGGIVARQGLALEGEAKIWMITPEKLAASGIDEEQFECASEQARAEFERHRAALY